MTMTNNLQFKLLSLNVRGIRSYEKRKTMFTWLTKQKPDIIFLQETYSTKEMESIWKKQWYGEIFLSHGTEHSRGTAILIRKDLDYKVNSITESDCGRYIIMDVNIQETAFILVNVYAPNKESEQVHFFEKIRQEIDNLTIDTECKIILGGDFNTTLDTELDCSGGNPTRKKTVPIIEDIMSTNDLVDIWRIRNPQNKRFTWRQKSPIIQRRLDFWLVSDSIQEDIESTDIITAVKTDHSAIVLSINGLESYNRGPAFWRFNASLL